MIPRCADFSIKMAATESKFRGVAVDVGNSALHLGWFDIADGLLGEPAAVFYSRNSIDCFTELSDWVRATLPEPVSWAIATVNDPAAEKLHDWLATNLPGHDVRRISHCDCPIPIRLAEPQNVGVDRLMACVAAFELCGGQPAVVIDAGTAVTVDLLAEGAFQGGAILPGMRMSASALDRYTEKLPYIETVDIDAPEPIGKSERSAN